MKTKIATQLKPSINYLEIIIHRALILILFVLAGTSVATAQDVAGANIIVNPSFDTNHDGWGSYFDYSWAPNDSRAAKGSVSVVTKTGYAGKACKVTITNAGTQNYSIQLSYPVALEAGKRYSMKFKASADSNRTVSIHMQSGSTTRYSSGTINLTTAPTTYGPYYFTAGTSDPANFFKFYLGGGGASNGISAYFDDVEVAEMVPASSTVPGAPTGVSAVGGSNKAIVSFTAPANDGGLTIRSYTVTSNPGSIKATGTKSPIHVRGLTEGISYTFTVVATNGRGNSAPSATSNAATPSFKPMTYYVSPGSGSDNNLGTSIGASWATLSKAHAELDPGDTVLLRTGTYPPLTIKRSGAPSRRITYKAYPGDSPLITNGSSGVWNLLQISASYITVDGIEVKGINQSLSLEQGEANYNWALAEETAGRKPDLNSITNTLTNGVNIGDEKEPISKYISVVNCTVHDCPGAGISAMNADYVTIENNVVFNNCWYSLYAPSGITALRLNSTDVNSNVVIRGNTVYNNYCRIKWLEKKDYSDGNGIIIDRQTPDPEKGYAGYSGRFLVENNVVYDNGGRGLYIMSAQNAVFRNNTSYWNSKSSFSTGGEMVVYDSKNVTYVNNVAWANPDYFPNNYALNDNGAWGRNSNITWKNNITFNGTVGQPSTMIAKTTTTAIDNSNKLGVNPLLINPTIVPANANFRLQSSSPAINAGTSTLGLSTYDKVYAPREQGTVDMGAYEFQGTPPAGGTGLTARYYNNKDFTGSVVTRVDPTVNFSWGKDVSPATGIDGSTYSIMWDGYVKPQYSGTYTFYTRADDGIRLWVNGQLLIDNYVDQGATENSGTISLTAGESYIIQIQYYNNTWSGVAQLSWSHAQQAKEIIPQEALFPAGNGFGLSATYYDNMDFTGTVVNRIDPTVNFNWGGGTPSPSIGADAFSVRWSGQVKANHTKTYTFYTTSDDGVRLWVNGVLLIDKWVNQGPTEHSGTISLIEGQKYNIVMEYYENTYGATAQLSWSSPSQAKQIIPSANLYSSTGPEFPVAANVPPSVSITGPASSDSIISGSNIVINADASDSDGFVVKVEFYLDTVKLGEDTAAPYSYTWNNVQEGSYALTAKAIDNQGAITTSSSININVVPAPPVITTNLAFQKPTTTDSYLSGFPGSLGVDGNNSGNGSRWVSANTAWPHWIEVDLQGTYSISKINFWTGHNGYNRPVGYKFQRWTGSAWVDVVSAENNTSSAVESEFTAVTTNKVRLYGVNGGDNYFRLYELQVWGAPVSGARFGAEEAPASEVSALQLFPNPAASTLTLSGSMLIGSTVEIFNASGITVLTQSLTGDMETLEIAHLPAGMYIVRVMSEGKVEYRKFLKL